jgi:biotin transport system substrate-specific component
VQRRIFYRVAVGAPEGTKCLLGALFIVLCARITIPFDPVPFTLQTFAVLLVAAKLGAKLGAYSVLLYLAAGVCGLPVFARCGTGIQILLSPTGGYLFGFVPAVYFIGRLLQAASQRSFLVCFLAGLVGEIILFLCGACRLAAFVGFSRAYALGVAPFLLADLLKLTAFACLARKRLNN